MGDLNTQVDELLYRSPLRALDLQAPQLEATFPSWKPQRCLDHILISPDLQVARSMVVDQPISDHLPVATELILPAAIYPQQVH